MGNLVLAKPQVISTTRKLIVRGGNFIAKQSPVILAGTAIVGVCSTAYFATKAGIRANDLVKEAEDEKRSVQGTEAQLTVIEKVEVSWKVFIPTAISASLTIGAIIASSTIMQKRQAALAGLYALSETALKEYQDKIEKEYGSKDAQKIRDEINGDAVRKVPDPNNIAESFQSGDVLCFDKMSARYFMSSVQKLRAAENDINAGILAGDMCASLNEFYSMIGLEQCEFGDDIGWNLDFLCKMYLTSCLTSEMKPCLVIDWSNGHKPNYRYRDI